MTALLEREGVPISPEIPNPPANARAEANRRNAEKSTGPKTAEGKARSCRNALKHGLTGAGIVRPEEEERRFQEDMAEWSAELRPANEIERAMVESMVVAKTRMRRAEKMATTMRAHAPNARPRRGKTIGSWKFRSSPRNWRRRSCRA